MTKQEIIKTFYDNHKELSDFINSLSDEQFAFRNNDKWSAGQQLCHVYLTLLPFPKVLPSKEFILQKFGKIDRPVWTFETLLENYFKTSLKSPERFLPEEVSSDQKSSITNNLYDTLIAIQHLLEQYTEEELDTLVLPHPLLGNLTIREMFYVISYHPKHHLKQIVSNLDQKVK
ncbi:MAG: DinB family protein [Saprospiraceae bacterium]|nr:DinB family protein [Saprospiraceae bacterium]